MISGQNGQGQELLLELLHQELLEDEDDEEDEESPLSLSGNPPKQAQVDNIFSSKASSPGLSASPMCPARLSAALWASALTNHERPILRNLSNASN